MDKVLLCYGDSNTWGYVPQSFDINFQLKRYSKHIRWPGLLQNMLGHKVTVIEEGLNGRTTNLDYHIPPNRNGKAYLPSCLYSHAPIDLVIIALGGNDMKSYYDRTANQIFDSLMELVEIINNSSYGADLKEPPQVLILSPILPLPISEQFKDENGVLIYSEARNKAKELTSLLNRFHCDLHYINISESIAPSDIDGLHLDEKGHNALANILYPLVTKILGDEVSHG